MNKNPFSKNPNRCARRRRDISLTVAIYRHKDLQRYAARGSISSTASHRLTRGTDHLMNREVCASKGDVPSVPQDNWQCTHDMARIRTQQARLSEVRVLPIRPSIASAQWNISRVFHFQKAHPMKVASVKQYHLCSSKRTGVQSLLLQISFNSTLAQADDRPLLA